MNVQEIRELLADDDIRDAISRAMRFTITREQPRVLWEKASAMTAMISSGEKEPFAVAKNWLERAMIMQTSQGYLNYSDTETYGTGHASTITPYGGMSASQGYPLLLLYEATKDKRYLAAAEKMMEGLLASQRTSGGGICIRREGPELWIDFIYQICPFLAKYGVLTGEKAYIDEAYLQFQQHAYHCVDPRTNLGRHAWCEVPNHFPQSTFWARGNGWLIAGGVDLVEIAPDHPEADATREQLRGTLEAMRALQDESGYMRHILDDPTTKLEASATVMFAYSAARAIDLGIVDSSFEEAAMKAFLSVCLEVNSEGAVMGVAVPPGGPGVPFAWAFYGQGFYLMAAQALKSRLGL